jgi:alanine racemase/tRNA threonylcarbamoyladenosine biosynthesis protein TsaE
VAEVNLTVATPEAMNDLGRRVGGVLTAGDVVVLTGDLGAGKTTLTRGLGEALQVRGAVTSPTFVIARTHPRAEGLPPLVHVDAYRLSDPLELDDLDIDFAGSIVVVEWGRGMVEAMAPQRLEIDIDRPHGARTGSSLETGADSNSDDESDVEPRSVTIRPVGDRWAGVAW